MYNYGNKCTFIGINVALMGINVALMGVRMVVGWCGKLGEKGRFGGVFQG